MSQHCGISQPYPLQAAYSSEILGWPPAVIRDTPQDTEVGHEVMKNGPKQLMGHNGNRPKGDTMEQNGFVRVKRLKKKDLKG